LRKTVEDKFSLEKSLVEQKTSFDETLAASRTSGDTREATLTSQLKEAREKASSAEQAHSELKSEFSSIQHEKTELQRINVGNEKKLEEFKIKVDELEKKLETSESERNSSQEAMNDELKELKFQLQQSEQIRKQLSDSSSADSSRIASEKVCVVLLMKERGGKV